MTHAATAVIGAINYLPSWLERTEVDAEAMANSYAEVFLGGLLAVRPEA